MSEIPVAPIVPSKPQNCKIVIASGKIEEGYCIIGEDLISGPFKYYYTLPGTNIIVDKMSANLFKYPDIKAFIAVFKKIISGKNVYALQPLRKDDYVRYTKGLLTSEEIERKFEDPISDHEGTYGKVQIYPTHNVAIKRTKGETDTGEMAFDIVKEIGIYRLLSEIACLPKMYRFIPNKAVELHLEQGTVLSEVIVTKELDINTLQAIMFRIAKCLRTIASQGVIHCDLKPHNMVLSSNGQLLIIDWGLAELDKSKGQKRTKDTAIQTLWWKAPEILAIPPLETYSNKIDIFSLGLIYIELYTHHVGLVNGDDEVQQRRTLLRHLLNWDRSALNKADKINEVFNSVVTGGSVSDRIRNVLLTDNKYKYKGVKMPEQLADLISRMLEFNHIHRINYDEIILHSFFQHMQRENIPKLPIFINNMPVIPNINDVWMIGEGVGKIYEINSRMRKVLFLWMAEVMNKFNKGYEALCLSWQLTDLYIRRKKSPVRKDLQLYGCVAMLIASKIYFSIHSDVSDFVWVSDNAYSTEQMIRAELECMYLLKGNIIIPTLYSYTSHYRGLVTLTSAKSDKTQKLVDAYLRDDIYAIPFSKNWQTLLPDF